VTALRVEADLVSRLVLPVERVIHLDALLMAAYARREGLPMLADQGAVERAEPLPIPIDRSACGRYFLASASLGAPVAREVRYVQRRFPLSEAIVMGGAALKRVATNAGACKAFRVPVETAHVPTLAWYALGDLDGVRELLGWVTRLGRRRAVGEGEVRAWRVVEERETWAGFPVMSADGRPLRYLPIDTVGLGDHEPRLARLMPPYWGRVGEEPVACP
jgi:CRISPR type IV-associated protein Csf3